MCRDVFVKRTSTSRMFLWSSMCLLAVVSQSVAQPQSTTEPPPVCENKQIDLFILLDVSSLLTAQQFGNATNAAISLLGEFTIDEDYTRVCIIRVSDKGRFSTRLNDFKTFDQLANIISDIEQTDSGNNFVDKALRKLLNKGFDPDKGQRSDVRNVGILFTDKSNGDKSTLYDNAKAVQEKATMYTVGVGESLSHYVLHFLASSSSNVYHLDSEFVVQKLAMAMCPDVITTTTSPCDNAEPLDLFILLDHSNLVTDEQLQNGKDAIIALLGYLSIGADDTRVSIMTTSNRGRFLSRFDDHRSYDQLTNIINGIERDTSNGNRADLALKKLLNKGIGVRGDRANIPTIGVYFTDTSGGTKNAIARRATDIKTMIDEMFTVGLGTSAGTFLLQTVASSSSHVKLLGDASFDIRSLAKDICT